MNKNRRHRLLEWNVSKRKLKKALKLAEEIDNWKSTVLSPYCLEKCTGSCCDFEELGIPLEWLEEPELRAIYQLKPDQELNEATLGVPVRPWPAKLEGEWISVGGGYKLNLKKCPAYKDGKCSIHDSPHRPEGCVSFPIDFGDIYTFGLFIHKSLCPAMSELDLSYIIERCTELKIPAYHIVYRERGEKFPDTIRVYH